MTILQRYVLKQFIYSYILSASGLIGIFLIIDFFERVDEFFAKNAPWGDIVSYYLNKIPFIAFYMGPQAVLLATVIALASLARQNEFTAMKACGIGVTGITLPIIGASVAISLLVLACNEYIAPITSRNMNYIFYVKVRENPHYGKVEREKIWYLSEGGAVWNIQYYDPSKKKISGVSIFKVDEKSNIRERIDAVSATWKGNQWEFQNVYHRTFTENGLDRTRFFKNKAFPVDEVPDDFNKIKRRPEELSLREMSRLIAIQAAEGKDMTRERVDMHNKFSYPFISIVLALIAIPLSLRSSRHGGMMFCIGVNMAMGFCFSFLYSVSISLGRGGTFDPLLAAWGPPTLFTAIGLYLILTLDSERILPV